jgi:hypothetical protein
MSYHRGRYHGNRITKREREALDFLYRPFGATPRDAFSHSPQCDAYLGASAMLSTEPTKRALPELSIVDEKVPGPHYDLLPGGEVEHTDCACWCHSAGIDDDVPPDYVNVASEAAADLEVQAENERERYRGREPEIFTTEPLDDNELDHAQFEPLPMSYAEFESTLFDE